MDSLEETRPETASEWSWKEPSDEEFERRRQTETFYRIYSAADGGAETNLYKFWAADDDAALATLERVRAAHPGVKCFFSTSGYYVDPDGSRHDTLMEGVMENWRPNRLKTLWFRLRKRFRDWRHRRSELREFRRTGHTRGESLDLISHILGDLTYNLKAMSENADACPQPICETAQRWLGKEGDTGGKFDAETMEAARRLWSEKLQGARFEVMAYMYYGGYWAVDETDPEWADVINRLKSTFPYVPGTDGVPDYAKLRKLALARWNAIWDWMKENGEHLWS